MLLLRFLFKRSLYVTPCLMRKVSSYKTLPYTLFLFFTINLLAFLPISPVPKASAFFSGASTFLIFCFRISDTTLNYLKPGDTSLCRWAVIEEETLCSSDLLRWLMAEREEAKIRGGDASTVIISPISDPFFSDFPSSFFFYAIALIVSSLSAICPI